MRVKTAAAKILRQVLKTKQGRKRLEIQKLQQSTATSQCSVSDFNGGVLAQ